MLFVLAEVCLLRYDLVLLVAVCYVACYVVELAGGRLQNCAYRLVLVNLAYVYALLVQAIVITVRNMLLIHNDVLLVYSLLGLQAGLLRLLRDDAVLVHVGGPAHVHEAPAEGADIIDVRMIK